MGKTGQLYIVIHVQSQTFCERLGSIFLSFVGEFFREFSQVSIKQIIDEGVKFRSPLFGSDVSVHQSLEIACQCSMIMVFFIVKQTGISFLGNDTHLFIGICECMSQTPFSNVSLSATEIIVFHLIHVLLADDIHLRQIIFSLSHAEQFGFHERSGGKAPASSGRGLIFDWSCFL